jgi:hypothetical protein
MKKIYLDLEKKVIKIKLLYSNYNFYYLANQNDSEYYIEEQDGKNGCPFKNWNLYFPRESN